MFFSSKDNEKEHCLLLLIALSMKSTIKMSQNCTLTDQSLSAQIGHCVSDKLGTIDTYVLYFFELCQNVCNYCSMAGA